MQEWWMILIMLLSGVLFAAGGTQVSKKIGGQKWLRRSLFPILLGLCLKFGFKVDIWKILLFVVGSMAVFSLGYGDKNLWWRWAKLTEYPKWFTALMIPLPILFIGRDWLVLTYPIVFLGMFWIGTKSKWKIFEFFAGAWYGACLVSVLK